ncbi:hypothetical protein J4479_00255 [Candidatus Woesearchaeota archaeon]|nr:hypothetical protein [Candidatus Woesearchaeota archaeon]
MTKIISAILILALLSLLVIAAGRIIISYGCWQRRWGVFPKSCGNHRRINPSID